ncbi:MAG: hypothetical protein AAGK57_00130 [Pseudomonadota bacterium]
MVAHLLDRLTEDHPGCRMAAYADLSTGMVLVARGETPAREVLDGLCSEASRTLALPEPDPDAPVGALAVAHTPDGVRIFLRHGRAPEEALCCLASSDLALEAFLPAARACLDQISGGAA